MAAELVMIKLLHFVGASHMILLHGGIDPVWRSVTEATVGDI